ncbi:hypothetical protein [Thioalbus denitrificans]|uniref:Uncharacterized protein n=1 Tax=Thioalbus denitrificans TaxID=547122 RepID=A0A369BT04_9GAMM|nr:hypothetical protein [Thioalbus denitrificans]RCX24769.1 hypothetical protein DFQ59_11655 [Thioalbus denitrificans]
MNQRHRLNAVPANYLGLWGRISLEDDRGLDTASQVVWLQSRSFCCDLRVPAERPDFSGVESLDGCTDRQLRWLMGQQGFAGQLLVEESTCHWLRAIDFQPDRALRDVGRMRFSPDYVVEEGVHAPYREVWRRLPPASGEQAVLELMPEDGDLRRSFLVVVGDWFMYARERGWRPPQAPDLAHLVDAAPERRALLLRLADFEISFGLRRGGMGPWEIRLSTLPFREGRSLDLAGRLSPARRESGGLYCHETTGAGRRRWRVMEWSGGFQWA